MIENEDELTLFKSAYYEAKADIEACSSQLAALRAEVERLRKALERIIENEDQFSMAWAAETAREALATPAQEPEE